MSAVNSLILKGDIGDISEIQLQYVVSFLEEKGYKNEEVEVLKVGAKGDNYIAKVKRFIVRSKKRTFQIIAKFAPYKETDRQSWDKESLFKNEITFYNEIFSIYDKLQDEAEVTEDERLRHPIYYGALSEPPNEVILLEDLSVSGFVMLNRFESLRDEEVRLVLKDMAKLHSLSFLLKNKHSEIYEDIIKKIIHVWDCNDEESQVYYKNLEKELLDILESESARESIKKVFANIQEILNNMDADTDSKYYAILQGDCWTNNVMFKMEEEKAVQCVMIDYQTPKEWFLVYDIVSFIFSSTFGDVRKKHYHDWITYYQDNLENFLADFDMNPCEVYPREKLANDLKTHGKFMFVMLLIIITVILKNSDEVIDDSKVPNWCDWLSIASMKKDSIDRLKQRLEELIASFNEYGYL